MRPTQISISTSAAVRHILLVCATLTPAYGCQQTPPAAPVSNASSPNSGSNKKIAQDAGGSETAEQAAASSSTAMRTAGPMTSGLASPAATASAGQAVASNSPTLATPSAATSSSTAGGTSTSVGSIANPCPSTVAWVYPSAPAANASLWQYARSQLGRVVGDGQCTELVKQWQAANHLTMATLATTDGAGDYIWGTLVTTISTPNGSVAGVLSGDIVQFKNVQTQMTDGNGITTGATETHHTAIVSAVSPTQNALCLLEQNSTATPPVSYGYLPIASLQTGVMHIYRYGN